VASMRSSAGDREPAPPLRIGLEIHARLRTTSKLFCGCASAYGAPPNTQVCPICLGLPGTLPVLNRRAVAQALRLALALGCEVAPTSRFARKHYFYPDLPRNYQITQYEEPLGRGGALAVAPDDPRTIPLERLHLEEDAGRIVVTDDTSAPWRVDLNRAGTPLVEIVTAPALRSGDEARAFVAHLRLLVRHLEIGDASLEEGSLRCDVNVSLDDGAAATAPRVELKNLNSLRAIAAAAAHEGRRQAAARDRGETLRSETRSWDPDAGRTVPLRGKEESADYRYLDEPDLPPLRLAEETVAAARAALPELPAARCHRWDEVLGLNREEIAVLLDEPARAGYFEAVAASLGDAPLAARWCRGEILALQRARRLAPDAFPVAPEWLAELLVRVRDGELHASLAKEVLAEMAETGASVASIVERRGLGSAVDHEALAALVAGVVSEQAREVELFHAGKAGVLNFLVGQVMARARGRADPELVRRLLVAGLGEPGGSE